MFKTNKNQSIFFLALKLLLFALVSYILYRQISEFSNEDWQHFRLERPVSLVIAVVLVVPNIWLAYQKWREILKSIGSEKDPVRNRHSFFAGIVTGMLTPNMIGNFIGRLYYFDKSKRAPIVFLTMIANYAQFLASLIFGWIAVVAVGRLYVVESDRPIMLMTGIGLILAVLLYFFGEYLTGRLKERPFLKGGVQVLKQDRFIRSRILGLSLGRFAFFTLQFGLVLHSFGEVFTWSSVLAIWQVYLITMIFPSLFLGKLGVKEMVAIAVLGEIGMNKPSILFASVIIWFVNSMSPALLGLIICKRPKND